MENDGFELSAQRWYPRLVGVEEYFPGCCVGMAAERRQLVLNGPAINLAQAKAMAIWRMFPMHKIPDYPGEFPSHNILIKGGLANEAR